MLTWRRPPRRWRSGSTRRPKGVLDGRFYAYQDVQPCEVKRSSLRSIWQNEGSFVILKKLGAQAYKVELPSKIKYHPIFHISLLKPYYGDQVDLNRGISQRAPMGMKVQHDKEVEEVFADWVVRHSNQPLAHELLVKWKGLPESEASWEAAIQRTNTSVWE